MFYSTGLSWLERGVLMEPEKLIQQECEIRIDKQGSWFYNSLPIINQTILQLFMRSIEQDGVGGYRLKIGEETAPLRVEDTPYVVESLDLVGSEGAAAEAFCLRLNDETKEILDLESFYIGKENVPYCSVKSGAFPARFLRPAYYSLAQNHICQDDGERFYILLNDRKHFFKIAE